MEVKVAIPKSETETPPPPSTSQENESERTSLETSSVQSKESNEGNENLEKSPLSDSSNEIKPPYEKCILFISRPLPSREVMFQSPLRSQTTFHPSLSQGPPRQSPSLSHSINLGASSYHYHSYGTDSVPLPPSRSLSSSLHGYDAPYKRGNYSIPNLSSFKDSPDLRPQYSSYNGVNNDYSNGFFSNSFEKGSRSLYPSNGYEYPYVSREDLNPSIPLSTSQEIYPERPYSANLSSFGETPHTSLPSAFETELLPVSIFITVLYSLESKKQSLSSFGLYPSKVSPCPPRTHANYEPKLSPRFSPSIRSPYYPFLSFLSSTSFYSRICFTLFRLYSGHTNPLPTFSSFDEF